MNDAMVKMINDYIQGRLSARLDKLDKEAEKQKKEAEADALAVAEIDATHARKRAEELASFDPNVWLCDAAARAKQISFATHPLKFTHPEAKGASSVYALGSAGANDDGKDSTKDSAYLCTAALAAPAIDVSGNAAALDVAQLLQLAHGGVTLAVMIAQNDMSALQPFAQNAEQLEDWRQSFQSVFADKDIRAHTLSKQVYFPLPDGSDHLLSPLFSSSLAQALFQRISDSRYPDAAKEARKLRREGKFSSVPTVDYVNVAVQKFGGTNAQNVSILNARRGGRAFLLSCQPPVWRNRILPSLNHKNAFWQAYARYDGRKAWHTVKTLKAYLTQKADVDSTLEIRQNRADLVDELMDCLLQYAAELQGMREHSGWSADSKLSRAEQLWLDPYRNDADFRTERAKNDWQQEIARQFAAWLNEHLKSEKLEMKDVEHDEWAKLLDRKLARLKDDLGTDDEWEGMAA